MADAAYQTVQTLQNLLDQKKELLRAKDQQIEKLREQMEIQTKSDANTIANLREQISATGSSTLSKLHEAAVRMEGAGQRQTAGQKKANADLSWHDSNVKNTVTAALDKKDRLIKKLETEKQSLVDARNETHKRITEKD